MVFSPAPLKLGCVPYINALPLTYFLDPEEFELMNRPPAQLFDLLQKGHVDAALLPIVNYFENSDLALVPQICIAAKGAVRSVKIFFKNGCPSLEKAESIALDPESKTSNLLLKTLLHHRHGRDLSKLNFSITEDDADVKVLIGDKALDLHLSPSPRPSPSREREYQRSMDLAELWWEWTKKPFVFAAWMTRGEPNARLCASLYRARERGLKDLQTILNFLPQYPSDFLKEYFTRAVHYYMGPEELEGVRTFYEYLRPIQGYHNELDFRFVS